MRGCLAAKALVACLVIEGGCVRYEPHVLGPVQSEAQFRARTLTDAAGQPVAKLDSAALTSIALRYSSDLEVARAKAASADAAMIPARQRINPSLSGEGGYNRTPESVATYSVTAAFTIETAGKRGFRMLAAQKNAEAARIALQEAEWQVRSRVRASLVDYFFASRRLALLRPESDIRREMTGIFEQRVSLGFASNPELNAVRAEQSLLEVSLQAAHGEADQALSAIASAVGVPVSALDGQEFDLAAFETPPPPDSLPVLRVQQAGLLHRADVRRALAEYETADARLRLELANQYPNITLSPAYSFQEGFPAYTLGAAIESLPVLHRHAGPIAEAVAARHEVEVKFLGLQAQVIAETDAALRQYRSAMAEYLAARDTFEAVQQRREEAVLASFRAGESDRLDLAQARLLALEAARTRIEAALRAQKALGSLEDAVHSALGQENGN